MSKDPEFMKKYNFYLKNKNIIDKKNKLEEEVNNNNYYMENQVESVKTKNGPGNFNKLLRRGHTWEV